jgi:hypothetical protein
LVVAAVLAAASPLARAAKPAPAADLAVDQVTIKAGPKLLGALLGRESDGTAAFAVNRAWLKKNHPHYFAEELKREETETRAAFVELRDRIADWRKDSADEKELEFFLSREAERIEKELAAIDAVKREEDAAFVVIDIPPAKIERLTVQQPKRKGVAQSAWREGLVDVETRSTASLVQELKTKKIEQDDDPDVLLDLLPPRRQNEAEWAARRAIVEYRFKKPLDFQGMGDVVVRTGEGAKPADAAGLFAELLKSLQGSALSDLLDPPVGAGGKKPAANNGGGEKWLASAVKIAGSEGLSGFRVTRVDQDLAAKRVDVDARFVARLPDGSWKTIWQRTETSDASKPRPDAEKQVLEDPQVRSALELVQSLGLGGAEQVKLAVRFGAAVQEAQKQADNRFFAFLDLYLRRLDGPVLRVAPAPADKAPQPARKSSGRK